MQWRYDVSRMHRLVTVWVGAFNNSVMLMCFALSTLFNKAKVAAMVGPIAVFVTVLPRYIFFGTPVLLKKCDPE